MNRIYTNQYFLASKMLKTTKLLSISLYSLWPKTSALSAQSASKKFVPIRVHSWMINTLYEIRSTNSYVRNYKPFFAKRTQFPKSQVNVNTVITTNYEQMDTWSIGKNEPKRTQNEPKTNPNEPKFKKAKMNVTTCLTMNYEQRTMIDEKKRTQFKPNSNPIPRWVKCSEISG